MQDRSQTVASPPTGRGSREPAPVARMSPRARRRQILDDAVALCISDGIDAVSMRRVAQRLGVTHTLVNHYFGSADQLVAETFAAVTESQFAELSSAVGLSGDPASAVKSMLQVLFKVRPRPTDSLWFDAARLARMNAPLRATFQQQDSRWSELLRTVIASGKSQGTFRCDDPKDVAEKCWVIIDGLYLHRTARDAPPEHLEALATKYVEQELGLPGGSLLRDSPSHEAT